MKEYEDITDCVMDDWRENDEEAEKEIRTDNTETLQNALKRIEELEEENKKLNRQLSDIVECFISASSGDDFEMAESAKEIMEILNIPCYRHGKVKSKLTEAKEIIKELLFTSNELDENTKSKAEQFLKVLDK